MLILASIRFSHLKKLTAILLLTLFVFNTIGYRIVLNYVQDKADTALEAKLDMGHYNDDELITIKVAVNMPYQASSSGFERVDGEINFQGQVYKYVKRSIQNDTMVLMCIPHQEKSRLQQTANSYFGGLNDLAGNSSNSKKAEAIKQLISDYDKLQENLPMTVSKPLDSFYSYNDAVHPQHSVGTPGQPPDKILC